jgi:NAD(P)H dehydrogenase (quinone)
MMGGGQEAAIVNSIWTLVHHGMIYVPAAYKTLRHILTGLDEIHCGSPWGADIFAVGFPPLFLPSLYPGYY